MTAAASTSGDETGQVVGGGRIAALLALLKNLVVGTLMCATPVTAVVALGWLMRYMRAISLRRLDSRPAPGGALGVPGWLLGPRDAGVVTRCLGGLWSNVTSGVAAFVGLALATLPFTGLWLLSWWAGWEISFNKSYEQIWVGPALGLTGTAIGLWVMAHLPMALAHQAVEGRWPALFELRRVRRLVAYAGWRYVLLAAATVVLALPLFGARAFPTFVEGFAPEFAELSVEELRNFARLLALTKAAYLFPALLLLRGWAARIYAHAVQRLAASDDRHTRKDAGMAPPATPAKRPWLLFRFVRLVLLLLIWFGLVAQIYFGQFLNHSWWYWLNHPYLLLPWAG